MRRSVLLHVPDAPEPRSAELLSAATAGGSAADPLHLPGLPPAALHLVPCAAGVVVEARASGVRAAGHPLAPGARRLLRAGERAELLGAAISVPPDRGGDGTRVLAAGLLRAAACGEAPIAGPHLVVLTGRDAGTRLALADEQVLGRGASAEIRLRDPLVSRRHARLRLDARGAVLEDLGAKNGVAVDGVRVERRPARLRDGSEIGLGGTTLALVLAAPAAAGAASPGGPERATGDAGAPAPPRSRARRAGPGHGRPIAAAALLAASAAALALSGL